VVELPPMRGQADFDIAETFTASQLGERHCQELLPTGQMSDTPVAVVAMDESIEIIMRNELEELSENGLSLVHRPFSWADDRTLQLQVRPIFKSFETVFALISFRVLNFERFPKCLTGH
jgi:hypothetical protein